MDRPLDTQVVQQRRRKKILFASLFLVALVALFLIFSALISPSIDRNDILTAIVQQGSIEGTISASGTVVPKSEQAISSPSETRILAARKKPGDSVMTGESILDVDRSEVTLALERTEKELSLKANRRAQLKIDMEGTLNELEGQLHIKNLRVEYLKSKSAQSEKMFELGGVSKDQLNQAKLEEHIADIERTDLEKSIQSTTHSLENQLEGVTTEVGTLMKEKADIERQLNLLSCRAERGGVITWIKDEIGASIHRGEIIARVADLSSYRVEATVSDIHASRLSVGMPARIRYNDFSIPGMIETVYPTIENGIAKVVLSLDDASNKLLHSNLRVDVYLITNKRAGTLKVKKGPFVGNEGKQDVFVVHGNIARRLPVRIGVISFDEVEIVEGLSLGDEVIISDMNEYKHLPEVKIH